MYLPDESGHRHYMGTEYSTKTSPEFIDITEYTAQSQLRSVPPNVISLEKSQDGTNFLVAPIQISQSSSIELLSLESQHIIASVRINVEPDLDSLYVADLIVHCVDALFLRRNNKTLDSINVPSEYDSVTVSLSMGTTSVPCYLLVYIIFNDGTIERLSSFDHGHYQMFLVTYDKRPISRTSITDGQLVTVKWTKHANISLFESSACREPRMIYTKKIFWGEILLMKETNPVTGFPEILKNEVTSIQTVSITSTTFSQSQVRILHISLYIFTALLAFFFLCLILHKIFSSKSRTRNQSTAPACYNITDPAFTSNDNKVPIRTSNSKNFSSLGKCSSNCIRQNPNKCHSNEPYPPLLPPPGPIAANYDLTTNDPICCGSNVDSGIELGKLSSYSSNTNPSNDLCGTMDQPMSTSMVEGHPYGPTLHFINPPFGYYTEKNLRDTYQSYRDNPLPKTISNLRPSQW